MAPPVFKSPSLLTSQNSQVKLSLFAASPTPESAYSGGFRSQKRIQRASNCGGVAARENCSDRRRDRRPRNQEIRNSDQHLQAARKRRRLPPPISSVPVSMPVPNPQ